MRLPITGYGKSSAFGCTRLRVWSGLGYPKFPSILPTSCYPSLGTRLFAHGRRARIVWYRDYCYPSSCPPYTNAYYVANTHTHTPSVTIGQCERRRMANRRDLLLRFRRVLLEEELGHTAVLRNIFQIWRPTAIHSDSLRLRISYIDASIYS